MKILIEIGKIVFGLALLASIFAIFDHHGITLEKIFQRKTEMQILSEKMDSLNAQYQAVKKRDSMAIAFLQYQIDQEAFKRSLAEKKYDSLAVFRNKYPKRLP